MCLCAGFFVATCAGARAGSTYAYIVCYTGAKVLQYRVGANATLIPLSPPSVPCGYDPSQIVFTPDHKFAYIGADDEETISCYRVAASGSLLPIPASRIRTKQFNVTESCTIRHNLVFISNEYDGYQAFTRRPDGSLVPITYKVAPPPLTDNEEYPVVTANGATLQYAPSRDGESVVVRRLLPTGKLKISSIVRLPGNSVDSATMSRPTLPFYVPAQHCIIVCDASYNVSVAAGGRSRPAGSSRLYIYKIGAGGALTLTQTVPMPPNIVALSAAPAGGQSYVYVAESQFDAQHNSLARRQYLTTWQFDTTGKLSPTFNPPVTTSEKQHTIVFVTQSR